MVFTTYFYLLFIFNFMLYIFNFFVLYIFVHGKNYTLKSQTQILEPSFVPDLLEMSS